ncbi:MAG: putative metal-binding motif-containing protein, partial [Desulfobacterales bacterium]
VYPVAPHRVNYYPWPGASLGDWDADIDADPSALLGAIDDLLDTSTLDPKPDLLYGWIPDAAFSGVGYGQRPGDSAFGQDDSRPNMLYRIIFAHEHGHNMDQRGHGNLPDATLTGGEFGYDVMGVDLADRVVMRWYTDASGTSQDLIDFMRGGAPAPPVLDGNHAWVTPYTYIDIHNEMSSRGFVTDGAASPYAAADTIYVSGIIDQIGSGVLHPIYVFSSHAPHPSQDGNYNIELYDRDGKRLYRHVFDVHFYVDFMGKEVPRVPFSFFIPYFPETVKIVLQRRTDPYDGVERSAHSPEVKLLYPNGGETLSGRQNIKWEAEDLDKDRLTYILLYSPDGGTEWTTLATRLHDTTHTVDMDALAGSAKALFRVMVSDGLLSAYDDSDASFEVKRKKPKAYIIHPDKELIFAPDHPMLFVGQGYDPEDGKISAEALFWESDQDGLLGSGNTLEGKLSVGIHTVTLRAQDSEGNEGTDTIIVHNLKGVVYRDNDGDGFGDPADTRIVFDIPEGYVGLGGDCDDQNDEAYPGAPDDVVDGIDNDCDILVDEDAAKWFQRPDAVYGVNLRSELEEPVIADDWLCTDGNPVAVIQFWGSYLDEDGNHWEQGNPGSSSQGLPPSPGIKAFRIRIYKNKEDSPYNRPGDLLREYTLLPAQIKEVYWSSIPHPLGQDNYWWEHKFYYLVRLPVPFAQDLNTVYWLSIGAATEDAQWMWGWETSEDQWNANACLYWKSNEYWAEIRPGAWPIPDGYPYKAVNMAFMLTTLEETCPGDFDRDRDVDGVDLARFMADAAGLALKAFAADFGTNSCP